MLFPLIISHLLFDYGYALTPKMIEAKSKGRPIGPIARHALNHAIGVFIILLCYGVPLWVTILLSLFEFLTHWAIDIAKGRIETKYPNLKDPKNPWTWHLFQLDQGLHISVKYIISLIGLVFI